VAVGTAVSLIGGAGYGLWRARWRVRNRLARLGRFGRAAVAGWVLWPMAAIFGLAILSHDLDVVQGTALVLFPPVFGTIAALFAGWIAKADSSPRKAAAEENEVSSLQHSALPPGGRMPAWLRRTLVVLAGIAPVLGALHGFALVKYAGFELMLGTVVFGLSACGLLRWASEDRKSFRVSLSLIAAHVAWMLVGTIVLLARGDHIEFWVLAELFPVIAAIAWLVCQPGWRPALLLISYEVVAGLSNIIQASGNFDPQLEQQFVLMLTLRVAAILMLLAEGAAALNTGVACANMEALACGFRT
jgi:hypothetical protein